MRKPSSIPTSTLFRTLILPIPDSSRSASFKAPVFIFLTFDPVACTLSSCFASWKAMCLPVAEISSPTADSTPSRSFLATRERCSSPRAVPFFLFLNFSTRVYLRDISLRGAWRHSSSQSILSQTEATLSILWY